MERKVRGSERSWARLAPTALVVFVLGCLAQAGAYTAAEIEGSGTISGRALFQGTPPERPAIPVRKDTGACGTSPKRLPDLRVGDDGGLESVVVSIEGIERGRPLEPGEPVLDQIECEFVPHVLLVPVGSTVQFRNSDGILHNVRTRSEKNPPFNRAQPGFKKVLEETFQKPEFLKVSCDAHEWMSAILVVHEHPYYAVTDSEGQFRIEGVPEGVYTLRAWHERLGERSETVTVEAEGTTPVSFTFAR